ncbi:Putative inorganic phosphate cotransporter [Araneus ventricosus]|uniref:Inorganic phosphate cotransporter n=1 Tax=Araneus ventricosus TaxID=182803 RepID=A0A4Y2LHA0_ARAVE|nr:Putative inorganic phosphate cotransporter [Araneus ventricosus]
MDTAVKKNVIKGDDDSILKCRYLVAFLEFFSLFQISFYRIATSISIVTMVNNTAINSHEILSNNTISCPSNYSDETGYIIPENDGEFDWSPAIQGYIHGSGFMGYVIALMPGGILAETYGAKIIVLSGLLLSTASHLLSPLAARSSSYLMITVQFLRGLGQGCIPAAQSVLSTNWFPKSERGFLNSLIMTGYSFGAVTSGLLSGAMCSSSFFGGWPSVYYIYGTLGLFLCLCFYIFVFESPMCHPRISHAELVFILQDQESDLSLKRPPTPWKCILTSAPVYAVTYAIFGAFWVGAQCFSIQTIFLGTILHFSIQENGVFTAGPFAFQVVLSFIASWICKWLNSNNYVGVDKVRRGNNFLFCLGYSLCILGVYYAGCHRVQSTVFSVAAMSFSGLTFSGCMIAPLDVAPNFAGTLMGFSYTIGSLSSFIFPVLVGVMTDEKQTLEEWNKIFWISIGIIMSSGIIFCVFGSAEVQPWNYPATEYTEKTSANENNYKEQVEEIEFPVDTLIHP